MATLLKSRRSTAGQSTVQSPGLALAQHTTLQVRQQQQQQQLQGRNANNAAGGRINRQHQPPLPYQQPCYQQFVHE
jgi:hypothetical protein